MKNESGRAKIEAQYKGETKTFFAEEVGFKNNISSVLKCEANSRYFLETQNIILIRPFNFVILVTLIDILNGSYEDEGNGRSLCGKAGH